MLNSEQDLDNNPNRLVAGLPSLQYSPIVTELSIEQSQAVLIFTQATAQAVRLTDTPVAILTAIGGSGCQIGSISGLEKFGSLPIDANLLGELAGLEYCHDRVLSNQGKLNISDCQQYPQLAHSSLVRIHGMRAYLGLPIITAASDRLGTISILDFKPREFSDRDIDLLQLVSRLVASEFERQLLSQAQLNRSIGDLKYHSLCQEAIPRMPGFDDLVAASEYSNTDLKPPTTQTESTAESIDVTRRSARHHLVYSQIHGEIQFKLMTHLAQELRTPLTSVLGMASVLQQEIYGSLSSKQKDYLGIIYHSGQQLVTIVDEIAQLGGFVGADARHEQLQPLILKSVDLEMICQLAIQALEPLAQKKQQQISLDLTGGNNSSGIERERSWRLDKDKIRQIIYYLCLSAIDASAIGCQISIQLIHYSDSLQIQIVTNDPLAMLPDPCLTNPLDSPPPDTIHQQETKSGHKLRMSLGLALSHVLAISHGGSIKTTTDNRCYHLTLPVIMIG
jgi:signal transduction histidine kinase